MELQQQQRVSQTQTQEQSLTHAQLQSLKILTATTQELQTQVTIALETNPVLEVLDYGNEMLAGDPIQDATAATAGDADRAAELADYDESLCAAVACGSGDDAGVDPMLLPASAGQDDEERRRHFFDSLTAEPSGAETLREQLRDVAADDPILLRVGEEVIANLDDSGYLRASDEELARATGADLETVGRAVALIQTFDPSGIGARTLRECLLAQLDRAHERGTLAWRLADTQLEALAANQIPQIARALAADVADVNEAAARLRELNPRPGAALFLRSAPTIVPDATIVPDGEGGWRVVMSRVGYPRLAISETYEEMARDRATPREARQELRRYITAGRQLIDAIGQRVSTIQRITEIIAERQGDFLEQGIEKLRPMTMAQVAEELGVHETTISRAIAGKFVRTPQGVFEYRRLFTTGYVKAATADTPAGGEQLSSLAIRQRIRQLIEGEDPEKPLSDQKLTEMLQREGVDIARRTVAKYREAEGLRGTSLRRAHR